MANNTYTTDSLLDSLNRVSRSLRNDADKVDELIKVLRDSKRDGDLNDENLSRVFGVVLTRMTTVLNNSSHLGYAEMAIRYASGTLS